MSELKDKISEGILNAVNECMEGLAFMQVSHISFYWAKIEVLQPVKGLLTIAFPKQLMRDIVKAAYGELVSELDENMLKDAVGEIANTVTGILLNTLLPEETPFELGLPQIGTGIPDFPKAPSIIQHLKVEKKLFVVIVSGEDFIEHTWD